MSHPYFNFPSQVDCPFCGAEDQYVEDLGDSPFFLTADCGECGKLFSYDCGRSEFYDYKGKVIPAHS